MIHNKVRRAARKLKRDLHGNISLISLMEYSKGMGYRVVFFNTSTGDRLLKAYNLTDTAEKANRAFTVFGPDNVVFINSEEHNLDKVYLLLHELGHIMLGHIQKCNTGNQYKEHIEAEANAFVYEVATHNNILLTALRETAEKIKQTYQSASLAAGNGGKLLLCEEEG